MTQISDNQFFESNGNKIPDWITDLLVAVGEGVINKTPIKTLNDQPHALADWLCTHAFDRMVWEAEVANRTMEDTTALFYGLVLAEETFIRGTSSVAGSIWVFRQLTEMTDNLEHLNAVASWALSVTSNPYVPFGSTITGSSRDYVEYINFKSAKQEAISIEIELDQKLEQASAREREQRRSRAESCRRHRKKEPWKGKVAELEGLSILDKLQIIATDPTYPPQFYPSYIAGEANSDVLRQLPKDTREELVRRLKGKRRGAWALLKRRLLNELHSSPWDRKKWML